MGGPRPGAPGAHTWRDLMLLALCEAKKCARLGEAPVGAILVDSAGQILAKAGNRVESGHDPCGHAEILVLKSAAARLENQRLKGCVLVTTLEPCLMCAGAISHSEIAGLVFGAADSLAGAIVSGADYYDLPGARRSLWHLGGIMSDECALVLREFFSCRRAN